MNTEIKENSRDKIIVLDNEKGCCISKQLFSMEL